MNRIISILRNLMTPKSAFYSWAAMLLQSCFLIFIIPLASASFSPDELSFLLSAMLLLALSTAADFGVCNTTMRLLPHILAGRKVPEFLHRQAKFKESRNLELHHEISLRTGLFLRFAMRRLFSSIIIASLAAGIIAAFIYQGRVGFVFIETYFFVIVLYLVSMIIVTFAKFAESILTGSGFIEIAKRNDVISISFRILMTFAAIVLGQSIAVVALIHFLSVILHLFLNYIFVRRSIQKTSSKKSTKSGTAEIALEEKAAFKESQYRFGLNVFSAYLVMNIGPMAVTNLDDSQMVSFYLIMMRTINAIKSIAQVPLIVTVPQMINMRIQRRELDLLRLFTDRGILTISLFSIGFLFSGLYLIYLFSDLMLNHWHLFGLLSVIMLLELNHSNHAQLVLTKNVQPFLIPSLLSGALSVILIYPSLTVFGVLGPILVQGVSQLIFSNWYSVFLNVKDFNRPSLAFYLVRN